MAALREAARRRLNLDPLTTSLQSQPQSQHQSQHHNPSSGLSATPLSALSGYNPSSFTPLSAVRSASYNPAQWSHPASGTPDSSSTRFPPGHSSTRPRNAEALPPPPPPPYSPPRSHRASMIASEEPSSGLSPANRLSPVNFYRSSPESASSPFVSPPTSTQIRAGTNDRPPSSLNVSSFSRRNIQESPRLSPEFNREHGSNPRRPVPISVEASSSEREGLYDFESRPPASRRAVSAGAISATSSYSRSRGSSTSRWEPGMPLPPPPPGPPPPSSRSQSMTPTDRVVSPPTRRPGAMPALGPVPPTPAGWVDDDLAGRAKSPNRGLFIDTSNVSSSIAPEPNSGSSSSGLARARAVRGGKSIRERRTESKTRTSVVTTEDPSNNLWAETVTPSDIVLPQNLLTRKPTITHSTPRSARSYHVETPRSTGDSQLSTPIQIGPETVLRGSTPRPPVPPNRLEAPTPPFSPSQIKTAFAGGSPAIPPKGLPTPPQQSRLTLSPPARPVSHILHAPNNDATTIAPLAPSRPGSRHSNHSQVSQISLAEQFCRAANERHQAFAQKEAAAATDGERVRLFAEFMVTESRLRRERYASAIDEMGSEILELTRDLFRSYSSPQRESTASRSTAWTPESSSGPRSPGPARSHRGSLMAALHDTPTLQTAAGSSSGSNPGSPATGRPESAWWTGYMPSLSPIPSMSVSEALDGDSRGRPSSRWWEVSQEGSNGTPSMDLKRSKRESKYMGMPRELREALQYENGDPRASQNGKDIDMSESNSSKVYGENEYPPEKVGWHEEETSQSSLRQEQPHSPASFSPAPATPNPNHLDVSRLVTLPPPYPRHHPAVNNSHPDLTSIRTAVRVLSDLAEVEATKQRFTTNSIEVQEGITAESSTRQNSLRVNIQREIGLGNMTYADAARIEATSLATEQEKTKEASKRDFELFQSQVVMPLNDLLMDRVTRSTELFTQLRSKLFVDAQEQSPNLTQEEGDEQPELLEKLTLLKWIFDAREQLHRELFDLLSERNNRYRDMIVTPYRLAGNDEKVTNAELFFAEDATKRKLAFEQEALKRTEEFMDIIEENVVRGVEVQLSAFWDIAPSLSRITERIPQRVDEGFRIQIPAAEYEENPSYHEFPMQYLYSLLGHCEKSTYQFIESQTNLLCLLHEVKSIVTLANCRLMRTQRITQGEDEEDVDRELKEVEADEELRLTDDLKEKVRCVEELWSSALGRELTGVKSRIVRFLIEQGGWDEDV